MRPSEARALLGWTNKQSHYADREKDEGKGVSQSFDLFKCDKQNSECVYVKRVLKQLPPRYVVAIGYCSAVSLRVSNFKIRGTTFCALGKDIFFCDMNRLMVVWCSSEPSCTVCFPTSPADLRPRLPAPLVRFAQ